MKKNYDFGMGEVSGPRCIVDDDASVRPALGRMVRSFGFGVQLLASGRDCLDRPYVDQASYLIVDVMLPDMGECEESQDVTELPFREGHTSIDGD